ncbi:hypothetical protein VNO80_14353 [Phaseolus coccineus]|uniref:18 kDa seed maturation protein n=1 Tax=Phaseolus coccineus TaxID=3886 RepID=A0AAN9MMY5_PHACN
MQAAKKAVENVKETAANIGASAKSGLEKTKATLQEKSEHMSSHDEREKSIATQKKEEKINQAEIEKQQARQHNAAVKQSVVAGQAHSPRIDTTGPGTDSAAYTEPVSKTSTFTTTGPGSDAIPPSTGLGPESAMSTGEFGQMRCNQTAAMTGPDNGHVLDHGPGYGGLPPMETTTVMDITAQTNIGEGSAPTSGPTFN